MRALFAGSRTWTYRAPILQTIESLDPETVIVHGACLDGADYIADRLAARRGFKIERFPAQWKKYGRSAGPMRNGEMVATLDPETDRAFIFWDGKSRGTKDILTRLEAAGIPTRLCEVSTNDSTDVFFTRCVPENEFQRYQRALDVHVKRRWPPILSPGLFSR